MPRPSAFSALARFIGAVLRPSATSSHPLNRRQRGNRYEALAAGQLERAGCRILVRQFRTRLGEIDLIAMDGDVLCFVEVRSKTSARFGTAAESVTQQKQRRLALVARQFLQAHPRLQHLRCRFDVVAVEAVGGAPPRIEVFRNAFTAAG